MFCNTASLYPVVMMATRVTDGRKLAVRLMGGLQTCLQGQGLEECFQQRIVSEMPEVQWAPIPDQSVLGSMNELILMAKYALEDGVESPLKLSREVAQTPMQALGMNSPDRAFQRLRGRG